MRVLIANYTDQAYITVPYYGLVNKAACACWVRREVTRQIDLANKTRHDQFPYVMPADVDFWFIDTTFLFSWHDGNRLGQILDPLAVPAMCAFYYERLEVTR